MRTIRTENRKRRMSLVPLIVYVCATLILLGGGCRQQPDSTAVKPSLQKVTICQWGQALIYLPLYIAVDKGYFADEGLDVSVTNGGADDLTWAAVTSGSAQFGIADPTMVAIQAEQGGVPGKVVGTIVGRVSFWAVTFDPQVKAIERPEDFKGRTIACFKFPNTAHALALRTFQKGKLTVGKDVNLVPVNYTAVLAQLRNKEADTAMVLEPAASLAVSEGARIVYSYAKDWGPFSFTGLTTTQKLIDTQPQLVQKVVNALQRAMTYGYADFEGAVAVGQKAFPDLSRQVVQMAVRRMLDEGTLPSSIVVPSDAWQKALDVCVQVDKLKKAPPTNAMVDNQFAEHAVNGKSKTP